MPNTISESLKTQIFFNASTNNTSSPISVLPSTNTALKQSLQAKYPSAVISSYLEIRLLDLSVKISSITEYDYPESVIKGEISPVGQNRDLVKSLWNNARKQLDMYHKFGSGTNKLRGSVSLLNKGSVNSYYLENLMGILTTEAIYPVSANEDILIGLADAGYGLLLAADEVLFTGVFTHYLTVTNDSFLTLNGGVVELATFDQAQSIINLLGTGTNNTPILNAITALQANLTTRLDDLEAQIDELVVTGGGGGNPQPQSFTKNYNSATPTDDLIYALGTNGGTVTYANPHPSKILITGSSSFGTVESLLNRTNGDWASDGFAQNAFFTIDFTSARNIILTGIGLQSWGVNGRSPSDVIISGSNNGTTFTTINTWNSIGFNNLNQFRFTTFSNTTAYRYLRVSLSGLDSQGENYLVLGEVYLYGTLSAL